MEAIALPTETIDKVHLIKVCERFRTLTDQRERSFFVFICFATCSVFLNVLNVSAVTLLILDAVRRVFGWIDFI